MAADPSTHPGTNHGATRGIDRASGRPRPSGGRQELQGAFVDSVRRNGLLMQLIVQAAADRLRINVTDLNCLNILSLTGEMTAGQLARAMGLTTASITGVLDRLEEAGYARRERDVNDRRRVVVRLANDTAERDVRPVFWPVLAAWHEFASGYTEAELELLVGFQRRGEELMREQLALMRSPRRHR